MVTCAIAMVTLKVGVAAILMEHYYTSILTVKFTIVPNFSKWPLSLVMVFNSLGIFRTTTASEGLACPRPPGPPATYGRGLMWCRMEVGGPMVEGGKG